MARAEQAAQRVMIQITERTSGESLSGQSSELSPDQRSEGNGVFYDNESTAVADLQESESGLIDHEAHWKGGTLLGKESTVAKVAGTAGNISDHLAVGCICNPDPKDNHLPELHQVCNDRSGAG